MLRIGIVKPPGITPFAECACAAELASGRAATISRHVTGRPALALVPCTPSSKVHKLQPKQLDIKSNSGGKIVSALNAEEIQLKEFTGG